MTFIEKQMSKELKEFDLITEEIEALEELRLRQEQPIWCPFPLKGAFKEEFIRGYNHMMKYKRVYIEDTMLIPYHVPEETFDDRLRKIKGFDLDKELENGKKIIL
jgi:hypothetical protein